MLRILVGKISVVAVVLIGFMILDWIPAAASENVINKRIELMRKDVLGNFKVIMNFVKSSEVSIADVQKAAKGLQTAAAQVPTLFIKGTGRPDVSDLETRALEKIWEDWASFEKANNAMSAYASDVAIAAAKGDTEGVNNGFGMIGREGCGGCHRLFRGPKAK